MSKSKSTKDHKKRLAAYKLKRKQQQERFKKQMYDMYIKSQQDYLASQEAHTDSAEQEVDIDVGNINLDEITVPDVPDEIIPAGSSDGPTDYPTTGSDGPRKPTGRKKVPKGK